MQTQTQPTRSRTANRTAGALGALVLAALARADAQLAVGMFSVDNKDRWIASVDFVNFSLVTQHRLSDPAWVGVKFINLLVQQGYVVIDLDDRAPGEFAAGAAVRPVTDWMQYSHEHTSQILNDPQIDPIAYARSSPIEFAAGLRDALLICHGVIDDNVLFEDSMRLYERPIELHEDHFTISPYPLDHHAFSNADSWLDEYKRIDRLFQANLQGT